MYICKTDVNECADKELNDCHKSAECINTNGSYMCTCGAGYTGDGQNCTGKAISLKVVKQHYTQPLQ